MGQVSSHINRGTVVMRILSVISGLLLIGVVGVVKAQGSGGAVSFLSPGCFDEYIGTYAEFAFGWGNGQLVSTTGEAEPLVFDGSIYKAHGDLFRSLQSKPFVLDKTKASVEFDLGYRFLVEPRSTPKGGMNQGIMILDLELYDVQTGEVHPVYTSLVEPYQITVLPGRGCDESRFDRVLMKVDPEWVSTETREVVLRVVFGVSPGRLVMSPDVEVSESLSNSCFNLN